MLQEKFSLDFGAWNKPLLCRELLYSTVESLKGLNPPLFSSFLRAASKSPIVSHGLFKELKSSISLHESLLFTVNDVACIPVISAPPTSIVIDWSVKKTMKGGFAKSLH